MNKDLTNLIKKFQLVKGLVIVGAVLGVSYLGYTAYEKNKIKQDKIREEYVITNNFEKTLDFVILKNNYQAKKDSLEQIYLTHRVQDAILENAFIVKRDSLLQEYKKTLQGN